jgi:hypothetical protein
MTSLSRKHAIALAMVLLVSMVGTAFAQDNQETYDEISSQVAEIRGLDLLDPINVEVKTREQLQQETRDDLATDYPVEDRNNDQRVLIAFGLLEPEQDLGDIYVGLLGEQVAGYYDPTTDEMVVVASGSSDELSASDKVTFAHEVVHALQDQHFDLESFSEQRIEGTSDESLAITALIEGDATVAQIDFLLGDIGLARDFLAEIESEDVSTEALDSAPEYLSGTLLFPYDKGQAFVQYLFDEGGWDLIDDAYANPPTTTEQILHPEKYIEGEGASEVAVPDIAAALGQGWQTIDEDTMGEYVISILLGDTGLSEEQVATASEGWGGDAYTVSATGDELAIAWQTEWDSEEDADEFATALAIRESERLDTDTDDNDGMFTIEADGVVVQIELDGTSVTYIQAPDLETLETVNAELDPTP